MNRFAGVLPLLLLALAQPAAALDTQRIGSLLDAAPALTGPSYYLQGNGQPMADAFQTQINQVAASPLDVVVLAASYGSATDPTPECDLIVQLANVNSCQTLVMVRKNGANDAANAAIVEAAEIVYFAGGDQCNYVGWKGSLVYNAVLGVVARGGGIGGGSAGLAIQGDYVYDGCTGSVDSAAALKNPYAPAIHFTYDYFDWPPLKKLITDTHFVERDRMGRLMAFLARQLQDGVTKKAYGLGIDADAAVVIDRNSQGLVFGGPAYVVYADHPAMLCKAGKPLSYDAYKIWPLSPGMSFDFATRSASGFYLRDVVKGKIQGDPYAP